MRPRLCSLLCMEMWGAWTITSQEKRINCRTKPYWTKLTIASDYLSSLLHLFSHHTITHDVLPHSHGLDQRTGLLLLLFRLPPPPRPSLTITTSITPSTPSSDLKPLLCWIKVCILIKFVFLLSPEPQLPNLPLSNPRSPRGLGITQ